MPGPYEPVPDRAFNKIIDDNYPKCPSCGGFIPNNETPGAYMGALSRRGLGEICSSCGTKEAVEDYRGRDK